MAYGGRGSAKSWSFMDAIVMEGTLRPVRILCTRELQNSIKESVKREIEAIIKDRDLSHFYESFNDEIRGRNGTLFMFKGIANNIDSIKSISDVDICFVEEAALVTQNSWDKLLPSLRPRKPHHMRGNRPIVIVVFNPEDELDDTWQRFVINTPPRSVVKAINWRDNKYFPAHLMEMLLHSLKTRPKVDHEHTWEGKPKGSDDNVIIHRDWIRAARFASRKEGFKRVGEKVVGYDPAGQGSDLHAVVFADGNIIRFIDDWVTSPDLRVATVRAFDHAMAEGVDRFVFDTCGGLGDGVEVFVRDAIEQIEDDRGYELEMDIFAFNAGGEVVYPDEEILGISRTHGETYSNAKAQSQGILAQKFYNTYRFIINDHIVAPEDMISIDIDDNDQFNNLIRELSAPLWVKSKTNSKKQVEDKGDMKKRTGQPSPNMADGVFMCYAPCEFEDEAGGW